MEHLCFSIVGEDRTLDLEAETVSMRDEHMAAWCAALLYGRAQVDNKERKALEQRAEAQAAYKKQQDKLKKQKEDTRNSIRNKYGLKK